MHRDVVAWRTTWCGGERRRCSNGCRGCLSGETRKWVHVVSVNERGRDTTRRSLLVSSTAEQLSNEARLRERAATRMRHTPFLRHRCTDGNQELVMLVPHTPHMYRVHTALRYSGKTDRYTTRRTPQQCRKLLVSPHFDMLVCRLRKVDELQARIAAIEARFEQEDKRPAVTDDDNASALGTENAEKANDEQETFGCMG